MATNSISMSPMAVSPSLRYSPPPVPTGSLVAIPRAVIPVMHITSKPVTYPYDVVDSVYDAEAIHRASLTRNHRPIIQPHTRPKPKTQLPVASS